MEMKRKEKEEKQKDSTKGTALEVITVPWFGSWQPRKFLGRLPDTHASDHLQKIPVKEPRIPIVARRMKGDTGSLRRGSEISRAT